MTTPPAVLVLLSGGIDSTACVQYYRERGGTVTGIFVAYGQPPQEAEHIAATAVANFYSVRLLECRLELPFQIPRSGEIRGRNALLLALASFVRPEQARIIALGIHAGSPYADCTPPFIDLMQENADLAFGGTVRIEAPFLEMPKSTIIEFARMRGVPLQLTHSCETARVPCHTCLSCRDRQRLM